MHVLLYHDAVIPPPKYGGTERIVYWLAKALAELGHRVTLIAQPGSAVPGVECVPLSPKRHGGDGWHSLIPSDVDLVHLWSTPELPPPRPYVVTIQGNGKPGERFHPNTLFISRRHAENHGARAYVHNGIDIDEYPIDDVRGDSLVFLAKASWKVKNLVGAIELARAAQLPLEVLGSRDWPLGAQRLLPAWRGVRYRGMVGDAEKRSVLRRARALLFPVRWPEPFGIALTEALGSGCPVFGTPYGSLPEIVTPDCGVLSEHADVLLRAIREVSFPPRQCRARVARGLTHVDMAGAYLAHYASMVERGHLAGVAPDAPAPIARFTASSETLLPWYPLAGR